MRIIRIPSTRYHHLPALPISVPSKAAATPNAVKVIALPSAYTSDSLKAFLGEASFPT